MAAKLGKNARVKIGSTDVARLTSMSISINNGNADITEFGDSWDSHKVTINNWSGSFDGYFDLSDTSQNTLHSKALSGGTIANVRFYEDATNYFAPDTATDADAMASIESYTWNADYSGIVTFSMGVKGSGPIKRT